MALALMPVGPGQPVRTNAALARGWVPAGLVRAWSRGWRAMVGLPAYVNLLRGDPAPWFNQRTSSNPRYAFDTTAGRYLVLCFYVSAGDPRGRAAIEAALARRNLFDDESFCFFGV